MKALLQSKRFRSNLYKWLFMYAGVMLLLTTVITYSRYISGLQEKDDARSAKFNVFINENCPIDEAGEKIACNKGSALVVNELEYYFTVDTRELEVKTKFILSILIDENFKINKLETVDKYGMTLSTICDSAVAGSVCTIRSYAKKAHKNIYSLPVTYIGAEAGMGNVTDYKVTVQYNGEITEYKTLHQYQELLTIGYSAEQITK